MHIWHIISNIALVYAAVVTTLLVFVYAFTRFEETQVGRQFMATKFSLALILDYWVYAVLVLNPPRGYTSSMPPRTVICVIVGTLMLRWLFIVIRAQRDVRRKTRSLS